MINATTPWRQHKDQPLAICTTPGEIDAQERFLYYWLARHTYRGVGEIVEIGALIGASSSCFAQGVLDNPLVTDKRHRLHVFDKFEAYPHLAEKFFPHFGITDIKTGDDFSSIYRRYTSPFAEQILLTKTDIADMTWHGAPIEILFVDCAQSPALSEKIMQVFYPYLIPGVSVVVDQDFFFERAWWFAAKAAELSDVLVPLYAEDCSLVSECRAAIPRSRLNFDFDNAPFAARIDALIPTA